ncbi:uncharacterized protein LOC122245977 isoform X1 [Penaeus japonicus]|uniref:uncharacterized protein LOC122245977 isoform X1 n=1 Tax=Penaeus japonicus TaxID=27405 RepID=UPI001C70D894|nr:uncharacterized protein LOC122245977 isoform X1 [Penaeus japonicus]XP_042860113.1 uncharacterized protein LOC122245977 isoform X1 [Penaeus japonicus]
MSRDIGTETGSLQFTYSYPMYEVDEPDGTKNTIALSSIGIGIILFLETLLDEGPAVNASSTSGRAERSIQEDQLEVFRQIEDNISSLGVDGRACVLRFICEMQTNSFSKASVFGELFTLLFTPKPGGDYTVLKEYIAAEEEGRREAKDSLRCAQRYQACPLSVFAALRRLRGDVSNGVSRADENTVNETAFSPTGVSYLKDSVPWAWGTFTGEGL